MKYRTHTRTNARTESMRDEKAVPSIISEAVRRTLPEARRKCQREAAEAYGEYLRRQTARQRAHDRIFVEASNDIALFDCRW